jgi:hypothetical protein
MPTRRPTSQAGPEIGIFWFIQEPGKVPTLLGTGVAVEDGEPYGDYINYPREHSQYWPEIKQRLPSFFHHCGAKDWPRGRVIYNAKTQHFDVYLNEQLQTPEFEAEILSYFNLPAAETSFASDPHYARVLFTFDLQDSQEGTR